MIFQLIFVNFMVLKISNQNCATHPGILALEANVANIDSTLTTEITNMKARDTSIATGQTGAIAPVTGVTTYCDLMTTELSCCVQTTIDKFKTIITTKTTSQQTKKPIFNFVLTALREKGEMCLSPSWKVDFSEMNKKLDAGWKNCSQIFMRVFRRYYRSLLCSVCTDPAQLATNYAAAASGAAAHVRNLKVKTAKYDTFITEMTKPFQCHYDFYEDLKKKIVSYIKYMNETKCPKLKLNVETLLDQKKLCTSSTTCGAGFLAKVSLFKNDLEDYFYVDENTLSPISETHRRLQTAITLEKETGTTGVSFWVDTEATIDDAIVLTNYTVYTGTVTDFTGTAIQTNATTNGTTSATTSAATNGTGTTSNGKMLTTIAIALTVMLALLI